MPASRQAAEIDRPSRNASKKASSFLGVRLVRLAISLRLFAHAASLWPDAGENGPGSLSGEVVTAAMRSETARRMNSPMVMCSAWAALDLIAEAARGVPGPHPG